MRVRVQIRNVIGANIYSGSGPSFPDLTDLVAMAIRLYGASPFFKVIVDSDGQVSVICNLMIVACKNLITTSEGTKWHVWKVADCLESIGSGRC